MPNYGKTYELYKRVPPGITGFWQASGRSDIGYEERLTMNAYYVRNWSVWLDLVILARTVKTVVLRRGAH
jgi:lipopolysaccharide/colanic/teichoic acid biosynthesis glycosyltransferase